MACGGSRASWFVGDGEGRVVRACRGLWVMVKGARRRGWWWSPVSGFVVVGAHRQSWVVGRSSPSMGWRCGRSSLFVLVVRRGVRVVDGGGRLWAVVEFGVVGVMLWALVVVRVGVVVG